MPPRKFPDFVGIFFGVAGFFCGWVRSCGDFAAGYAGKNLAMWGTGYGNAEIAKKQRWRGGENRTRKRQVVENIVGRSKRRLAARKIGRGKAVVVRKAVERGKESWLSPEKLFCVRKKPIRRNKKTLPESESVFRIL